VGSPKRIQDHGSTQAPSSFERDEVATDFSDGERDAIDSVVSVATYALDTRKPAALASCPDQFADIGATLALVIDPHQQPVDRLAALHQVRGALRRPLQQLALEDGGGQLAQRLENLLVEEQARLIKLQQRQRVDQSGWLDGKVVDDGGGTDTVDAVEALTTAYETLRQAAAKAGVRDVLDARFDAKSKTGENGMSKMGLALDALEFVTSELFDELAERAMKKNLPGIVEAMGKAGDKLNGTIGGLTAAFGMAEGIVDLLSDESSTMAKIDGGRAIITNGMQLVGAGGQLAGASWGAALAGAGTWLTLSYQYLKLVYSTVEMGWEARIGLTRATLNNKLDVVQQRGLAVYGVIDKMERAHALASEEHDPAKRKALEQYERELATEAGELVDKFIGELEGPAYERMRREWSLDVPIMQKLFAPLMDRRGLRSRDQVVESMRLMFEGLAFGLANGRALAHEMTTGEAP